MIIVSAFRWVPSFAQGFVRDFRVRWALEEAGLPYEAKLLGPQDPGSKDYRAWQPFGQVPAYQEGDLKLFESGAILQHIAHKSQALAPADAAGRARMAAWMFAALNSMEPHLQNFGTLDVFYADEDWARQRRPSAQAMAEKRLDDLAAWLDGRDYLEDRFTAADLLMTDVLRGLAHTDLVASRPALDAYFNRCRGRPAFDRALAAQMAVFAANAPAEA